MRLRHSQVLFGFGALSAWWFLQRRRRCPETARKPPCPGRGSEDL